MNRKKFPKNKQTPILDYSKIKSSHYLSSKKYVEINFENNLGEISENQLYPTDYKSAKIWFKNFLISMFEEFGIYEDAVLTKESIINHSILSPLLNSGLLNPNEVLKTTIDFYKKNNIPINSAEGFIRQIIGWREFIRGVYFSKGSE